MNPYARLTERQATILRAYQDAHARDRRSARQPTELALTDDDDVAALVDSRVLRRVKGDDTRLYAPLGRAVFDDVITAKLRPIIFWVAVIAFVALILTRLLG